MGLCRLRRRMLRTRHALGGMPRKKSVSTSCKIQSQGRIYLDINYCKIIGWEQGALPCHLMVYGLF
jgi:hypothetical protein